LSYHAAPRINDHGMAVRYTLGTRMSA
jgi:hypothetical protein